jgi:hypothetical protein
MGVSGVGLRCEDSDAVGATMRGPCDGMLACGRELHATRCERELRVADRPSSAALPLLLGRSSEA